MNSSKIILFVLFFLSIFLSFTTSDWTTFNSLIGSQTGQKFKGLSKLKTYLHRLGYNVTKLTDEFDVELESAVKLYQKNFNLNITGKLDKPTVIQMEKPRCGVADVVKGTMPMYAHPYMPVEFRIPEERSFTYGFDPRNKLSDDMKGVFVSAFKRWSKWAEVKFTEDSYSGAEIKIGFYSGEHGDGEAFDGMLGTLGYAFATPNSLIHLDSDESWDYKGHHAGSAMDLETVVVHEIGHVLGLGHSSVEDAVMFPTIVPRVRKVELDLDDIECVQILYRGKHPDNPYSSIAELTGGHFEKMLLVRTVLIIAIGLLIRF